MVVVVVLFLPTLQGWVSSYCDKQHQQQKPAQNPEGWNHEPYEPYFSWVSWASRSAGWFCCSGPDLTDLDRTRSWVYNHPIKRMWLAGLGCPHSLVWGNEDDWAMCLILQQASLGLFMMWSQHSNKNAWPLRPRCGPCKASLLLHPCSRNKFSGQAQNLKFRK